MTSLMTTDCAESILAHPSRAAKIAIIQFLCTRQL
jgi:hypothetical protein